MLFIGAGRPWTGGAGYLVRQRMFIEALREVADVRLILFQPDGPSAGRAPDGWDVREVAFPSRRREQGVRSLLRDLFDPTPTSLRGWDLDAVHSMIADEDPDGYDAVFAYRVDHAHFAGVLGHPRLLLDIDDPEHIRRRRRYDLERGSTRAWRVERDLEKLAAFEQSAAAGAIASFVCQPGDAAHFAEAGPIVVPNCVAISPDSGRRGADARTLVALGNFAGPPESPNVDGLWWFLDDVWPIVHRRRQDAELQIVGRVSDELRRRLEPIGGVRVLGFVESLATVFGSAGVSIAPIRFGTGTRVKIIESMAHGCPVVTTTPGCDGLEVRGGHDVLIADEAEEFAAACLRLLDDPTLASLIGQGGREVALTWHDSRRQHARLVGLFSDLLELEPPAMEAAA